MLGRAPDGEVGSGAMEEDDDDSQAVVLHEDKKYFPDAEEVCVCARVRARVLVCVCMCVSWISAFRGERKG